VVLVRGSKGVVLVRGSKGVVLVRAGGGGKVPALFQVVVASSLCQDAGWVSVEESSSAHCWGCSCRGVVHVIGQ
jgi:hypothetical protein